MFLASIAEQIAAAEAAVERAGGRVNGYDISTVVVHEDALQKLEQLQTRKREIAARPKLYRLTNQNGVETLQKLHVVGRRRIHGVATTPTITSNHTSSSSRGCVVKLPVPLLFAHEGTVETAIGDVVLIRKSDFQVYVVALVFEANDAADHAWDLIERGEVRCFSVGRADIHIKGVVDRISFIDRWRLKEVSICRKGANPDCWFEVLK